MEKGSKLTNRLIASLLTLIWIGGGITGLWISFINKQVILFIISLLAVAYGGLWFKVAQKGRKLDWQVWRKKEKL